MSVRFVEKLSLSGIRASIGSVGDAYDNALAGTTSAYTNRVRPGGLAVSPRQFNTPERRRVPHRRLRRLVQPAAPHAPPRPSTTHRSRGPLLFPTRDRPTGRLTKPRGCMTREGSVFTPISTPAGLTFVSTYRSWILGPRLSFFRRLGHYQAVSSCDTLRVLRVG
jgi:hypothetical protein